MNIQDWTPNRILSTARALLAAGVEDLHTERVLCELIKEFETREGR